LYQQDGPAIFSRSAWDKIKDLDIILGAKYDNKPLKKSLERVLGDITLGDLKERVLISSFELEGDRKGTRMWKLKFFENFPGSKDRVEKAVDVALRTSAAPTYFPIYQGYVDGGVAANTPSACAFAQALDSGTGGQKLSQVTLLSIGTGVNPRSISEQNGDWGLVEWGIDLVNIMLDGSVDIADYQCQRILGKRYKRIQTTLNQELNIDDVKQIPELLTAADHTADVETDAKNPSSTIRWLKTYYKLS
jgi:patatin-like phospholipase/acyl hydrolase